MRLRTVFASTKNWLRAVFYVSETGLKNVVIYTSAAFFDDFCPTSAVAEAISNSRMLVILITCYYDFNYNNCPISAVPGKNENNKYQVTSNRRLRYPYYHCVLLVITSQLSNAPRCCSQHDR